jgi:LacI family transcriptional regulator
MVNIEQIAHLACVSTATVSHVLNGSAKVSPKLKARVLKVVRDLNYHPNYLARSLRTRETKTVGMVITDITNAFYPAVVRGAEDVFASEGYTLVVGNTDGDAQKEEAYYRTFIAKRVDGLLLITCPTAYPPAYLSRHNPEETPVVLINRDYPSLRADAVLADHQEGSRQAVFHLLDLGHQCIGIVTGPAQHVSSRERLLGYERALRDHGLPIRPELIREGRFDIKSGYEQTKALLCLPERPTALFICNAPMAMAALRAVFDAGLRCPEDVALVSYDDLEWFDLIKPRITAVAQPAYKQGASAAGMLLKRISGELTDPPCRKLLATELIVRESTSPPGPPGTEASH